MDDVGAGRLMTTLTTSAPPRIVGALLVVAMTLGFVGTDYLLMRF